MTNQSMEEKILIIDSSKVTREILYDSVSSEFGYRAIWAESAKDGLQIIKNNTPDLILLDLQLPDISGIDLLRTIVQEGYDIPVVLMADYLSASIVVEALRLGMRNYLIKPFLNTELGVVIDDALRERRLRRDKERLTLSLQQRVQELTVLYRIGKSVTGLMNQEKLLERIVEAGVYITQAEEGFLLLLDTQHNELYLRAAKNLGEQRAQSLRMPIDDTLAGQVVRTGKPIRLDMSRAGKGLKVKTGFLVRAILQVPLQLGNEVIGVLAVDNQQNDRSFSENDQYLLAALADYAAIAIENTRLYEELRQSGKAEVENLTRANEAIYHALAHGLGVESIEAIATYTRPKLPSGAATHMPDGLEVILAGFDAVSASIRAYRDATAPTLQRDLMLQAGAQVEEVAGMAGRLAEPFGSLLALMISRWRPLIAEEGGRLARAELSGPVPNPYVAGNPVRGALFIGREDVLRRLRELWGGDGQRPSVILFGHRRMGKSSILHNLGGWLGADTAVITINLQRLGLIESTGDLLYTLAEAIHAALPADAQRTLGPPDEARFLERNPYTAFDQYLRRLDAARGGLRLLLALDEFEKLEEWIAARRVEAQLLDALRGLIQTYPWFVLALAGLHTLEEMTHDYWNPLFGSITAIPVSFLSPEGARRLITQPSPEFAINYAPDAVAQIVGLTNGQPYLVQLIGHALVTRFNRQSFEEGIERERRFTVDDVAAVIGAPEFHRDGHAYFDGVWNQARQSQPPGQERLLGALAARPDGLDEPELLRASGLDPALGRQALAVLAAHDVVAQAGGRYRFTVELMRRWVAQEHG